MDTETNPERKQQLKDQYEAAAKWGPGGDYRQALTALTLAAGGNVTGGAGEFVQAAAVNYLQGLGAAKIKEISPMLEAKARLGKSRCMPCWDARGCGEGAGCGGGAAGASAGIVVSQLLDQAFGKPAGKLDAVEREARINGD